MGVVFLDGRKNGFYTEGIQKDGFPPAAESSTGW
jgi:hypothetical protein